MSFPKSSKKRKGKSGKSQKVMKKNLESCELFVAGFLEEKQEMVRQEFEKIGKLRRFTVAENNNGMFAFVTFESRKLAAKAIRLLNNCPPLNVRIQYQHAKKTQKVEKQNTVRPMTPKRVSAFTAIAEPTAVYPKGGKKKKITKKKAFKKKQNFKQKEKMVRGDSFKLVPKGVRQGSASWKERSNANESDVRQVLVYAYPSQVAVRYIPLNVPIPGCYDPKTAPEKLLLPVNPYDAQQPILPYPVLKRGPSQKLCRST
jgi:hypothetical protein